MTAPTNVYKRNTGPLQRSQGCISGTYTAATDVSTTANAAIAAGVLTLTLGFVPTHVVVQNVTNCEKIEWWEGMPSGYVLVTQNDGDCTLSTAGTTMVVALRTGSGGVSGTNSGGTADSAPGGVVTITFAGTADAALTALLDDSETLVWVAEG